MRRANHLLDRIADRENLRIAVHKALKGKRDRHDARALVATLDASLDELRGGILRGDVALGEFRQFTIHDPKERLITAPCFRERVLHHAILNICEPVFERWLIADTYACRVGRGRLAALQRARAFAARSRFFLKLDIRKYFASISHPVLERKLARLFKDGPLLALLGRIIASFESAPDRGLPIGSLTSQHFANFYLGWFDRFVKQGLRVRGYVRYMDDCALWAGTSRELNNHLAMAAGYLGEELELKPSPYINRTRHGMDFLGARVFPDHMTLNRRGRVRFRRKLRALEAAHGDGRIGERELQQRASSLVAFTRTEGLSSWRFRQRVIDSLAEGGHNRPRSG
jgi:RNA-directed DNA polymerase